MFTLNTVHTEPIETNLINRILTQSFRSRRYLLLGRGKKQKISISSKYQCPVFVTGKAGIKKEKKKDKISICLKKNP